jgi:hypothetical protein
MTMKAKEERILDGALPLMRDYIVEKWYETDSPVRASKGDAEVAERASWVAPRKNPSGWWGRAWSAVEAIRRGEKHQDAWMMKFADLFRGLSRVRDRQSYLYKIIDPKEAPSPVVKRKRDMAELGDPQGRERRIAIEQAGMKAARDWLHEQGFKDEQIKDTHASESWDFEAEANGKTIYVEAKGIGGTWLTGSKVIVTRNEVEHARKNPDSCVLIIAAECSFTRDKDGRLHAKADKAKCFNPWRPDDGRLDPTYYEHWPKH